MSWREALALALACSLTMLMAPDVIAKTLPDPPDTSWKREIGAWIFVMLVPGEARRGDVVYSTTGKAYPKSGLYPASGTITPVWTVDWYSQGTAVFVSPNGRSVTRWLVARDLADPVIVFYERGRERRRYRLEAFGLSEGIEARAIRIDRGDGVVRVDGGGGLRWAFDVESGDLRSGALPHVEPTSFTVRAVERDGVELALRDFTLCGQSLDHQVRIGVPRSLLHGRLLGSRLLLRFTMLERVRYVGYDPERGDVWEVRSIDGTVSQLNRLGRSTTYCGTDASGRRRMYRLEQLSEIVFR